MAAPTLVNSQWSQTTSNATSIVATMPGSRVTDNVLLAFVCGNADSTMGTSSDWVQQFVDDTVSRTCVAVYSRRVDGTEANPTFTLGNSIRAQVQILQLNDIDWAASGGPFRNQTSTLENTTSATCNIPAITPNLADCMVLRAAYYSYGLRTVDAWADGSTEISDTTTNSGTANGSTLGLAYQRQTSPAALVSATTKTLSSGGYYNLGFNFTVKGTDSAPVPVDSQVSQVVLQMLGSPNPDAQVAQLATLILGYQTSPSQVSQALVQVLGRRVGRRIMAKIETLYN